MATAFDRQRETLDRATTGAQRQTIERLHDLDRDAYVEKRQGKSVIAAFKRYVKTGDPAKIDTGLYRFATGGAGGLNEIAHYNIDGFRGVYRHPAMFLRLLDQKQGQGIEHASYVYTDGLTAQEVRAAIYEIADEHRQEILDDHVSQERARNLAAAERLADELGMQLVPREEGTDG